MTCSLDLFPYHLLLLFFGRVIDVVFLLTLSLFVLRNSFMVSLFWFSVFQGLASRIFKHGKKSEDKYITTLQNKNNRAKKKTIFYHKPQ